eukprot:3070978-Amphidinium_carterae.1
MQSFQVLRVFLDEPGEQLLARWAALASGVRDHVKDGRGHSIKEEAEGISRRGGAIPATLGGFLRTEVSLYIRKRWRGGDIHIKTDWETGEVVEDGIRNVCVGRVPGA